MKYPIRHINQFTSHYTALQDHWLLSMRRGLICTCERQVKRDSLQYSQSYCFLFHPTFNCPLPLINPSPPSHFHFHFTFPLTLFFPSFPSFFCFLLSFPFPLPLSHPLYYPPSLFPFLSSFIHIFITLFSILFLVYYCSFCIHDFLETLKGAYP